MPIIGGRQIGVRGLGFQGAGKPSAPISVSATDVGTGRAFNNGAATVTWVAPSSNGAPITSYTVTSSPGSFTATTSSTSVQVTGLQSNTSYTFTVTATNAVGTSDASAASAAMTATTVPQAPTIGTATVPAVTQAIDVAYTAGATGGKAVTYTATSSPGSFTGTGASPIRVSGLTNGTAYTFTVTATNANGTSVASAASNSVTPALPTGFYSIATAAPANNTVSTVTFNGPFTDYKQLQLRISSLFQNSNTQLNLRFNGVSGTSYAWVSQINQSNVLGSAATRRTLDPQIQIGGNSSAGSTADSSPYLSIVDIFNPNDTGLNKFMRAQSFGGTTAGFATMPSTAGQFTSASAISSITISSASGANLSNASIALYGVT
jgi:chitodextrinase